MLTTFVIVGIHSTIYWGNLMSIEAILILQLSLSVIGLLVRWNVGSLVGTSDALFWLMKPQAFRYMGMVLSCYPASWPNHSHAGALDINKKKLCGT